MGISGTGSSSLGRTQPLGATVAIYDRLSRIASCEVSSDGIVWYRINAGLFSPLRVVAHHCPTRALGIAPAPVPSWARPNGPTRAIFSAVTLVEAPRDRPVEPIQSLAHSLGVPLTYLLGSWNPANVPFLTAAHAAGDDVQVSPPLVPDAKAAWTWFEPVVSVLGAGSERLIEPSLSIGYRAFWGITWNSKGIDLTSDRGTPWGFYCADIASYKRPSPLGDCRFAGVEWTARDLTMAYESGREDAYSTDPDDLRLRAHLRPEIAAQYARQLVDAYAAAGEMTPLLMVAQEEAWEYAIDADDDGPILRAMYDEARRDGMYIATLSQAVNTLTKDAGSTRVIAFPSLALSGRYGEATIDAHDAHVGLTFRAAELLPSRVFAYDRAPTSSFNAPIPQLTPDEMPSVSSFVVADETVTMTFQAPKATAFGVAFWSDPTVLGWTSPNVIPAGRAGAVAFFNLGQGETTIRLGCKNCTSASFPYAGQ